MFEFFDRLKCDFKQQVEHMDDSGNYFKLAALVDTYMLYILTSIWSFSSQKPEKERKSMKIDTHFGKKYCVFKFAKEHWSKIFSQKNT